MINLGILVSGRGSNLQAIIDASERGEIPAKVAIVVSSNPEAYALERCKKHKIPAVVINHKDYKDLPAGRHGKNVYEAEIIKALKQAKVDLVCLAGYMRIVGPVLLEHYKGRMMNIHPALLPSFPGLHAQKQALEHGAKISGVTVHFVDEGCDTGPIILQKAVEVKEGDTEESLSARILEQEHKVYPEAIKLFAEGKLKIEGRRVKVSG